jgi:hypothetical protein
VCIVLLSHERRTGEEVVGQADEAERGDPAVSPLFLESVSIETQRFKGSLAEGFFFKLTFLFG